MRSLVLFVVCFVYAVLSRAVVTFFVHGNDFTIFSPREIYFGALYNSTSLLIGFVEALALTWLVSMTLCRSLSGDRSKVFTWTVGVVVLLLAETAARTFVSGPSWPDGVTLSVLWYNLRVYAVMMVPVVFWGSTAGEITWRPDLRQRAKRLEEIRSS